MALTPTSARSNKVSSSSSASGVSGSSPKLVSSWVTKLRRVFSRPRRNRPSQSISSRDTWSTRRPWAASTSADQVKSASKAPSWGSASPPVAGLWGAAAGSPTGSEPALVAPQGPGAEGTDGPPGGPSGAGSSMARASNCRWRSARWAAACSSNDNPGAALAAGCSIGTSAAWAGSGGWGSWTGGTAKAPGGCSLAKPSPCGSRAWACWRLASCWALRRA